MVDPDALRYLRIAEADLVEAQRMVELTGFRDSSIGFRLQQACEKALKKMDPLQGRPGSLHPRLGHMPCCTAPAARRRRLRRSCPFLPVIRLLVSS